MIPAETLPVVTACAKALAAPAMCEPTILQAVIFAVTFTCVGMILGWMAVRD